MNAQCKSFSGCLTINCALNAPSAAARRRKSKLRLLSTHKVVCASVSETVLDVVDLSSGRQEIVKFMASTYGIRSLPWISNRVDRALSAFSQIVTEERAMCLQTDIMPKVTMLDALSPGLGWKVFSRYPEEFIHPDAEDYWRIMAACLYTTGFAPEGVSALFKRHICLFSRSVKDPAAVRGVFDWLRGHLGLKSKDIIRMVDRHPLLLMANVSDVLEPRVLWMSNELGLTLKEAAKAVQRQPEILGVDSSVLQQRVDFLTELGLQTRQISRLFVTQPAVLLLKIEDRLRPIVNVLRDEFEIDGDLLIRIIATSGLLSRTPEFVCSRASSWMAALDIDRAKFRVVLHRFPRLLLYSLEQPKYRKKVEFLTKVCELDRSTLVTFPQYISYSLSTRIAPRMMGLYKLRGTFPSLQSIALKHESFLKAHAVSEEEFESAVAAWSSTKEGSYWMNDDEI